MELLRKIAFCLLGAGALVLPIIGANMKSDNLYLWLGAGACFIGMVFVTVYKGI